MDETGEQGGGLEGSSGRRRTRGGEKKERKEVGKGEEKGKPLIFSFISRVWSSIASLKQCTAPGGTSCSSRTFHPPFLPSSFFDKLLSFGPK